MGGGIVLVRMIYLEPEWEEGVSEYDLPGVCVGGGGVSEDDLPGVCVGGGVLVRMIYLESVWEGGISEDDLPRA